MTITSLTNIDILNTDIKVVMENDESYLELKNNIDKAVAESQEIVVMTAADVNTASNYVANFKKIGKEVETLRTSIKQPLLDKGKEVDSFFKSIPLMFDNELNRLSKEILDFKRKQDEEAKKKAATEKKRLEDEAINNAIEKGLEEPAIIPEVIAEKVSISSMNTSNVTTRKTKTFQIVDESLIPREYLIVDEKKIRAERMKYDACNLDGSQVKSTIAGVEFTFNESVI